MTAKRGAIICVGLWRLPPPSPSPDATILNYPNDREMGAPLSFVRIWRPPPQTPQYLTILPTERGAGITFCKILAPTITPPPPPSTDATILNYLNDREGGRGAPLSFIGFWGPPPSLDATILNYLNDRERGAPLSFVGFWRSPPPPNAPTQTPQYLTIL